MSPELITAISSVVTALVIAATAVAAIIQLRHLRAGNAIDAILSFRSMLEDEEHRKAVALLRGGDLARALEDPQFRRYLYRLSNRLPLEEVPERYVDLHQAAICIGNSFELIGGMLRNRVVPTGIFLPNYWWTVSRNWTWMQEWVPLMREYTGSKGLLEDFEFLTVLCRRWSKQHPDTYARGFEHIAIANRYPLSQEAWFGEFEAERAPATAEPIA